MDGSSEVIQPPATPPQATGQRKVKHAREQSLLLALGFVTAVWMKAPTDLFVAFVVGLTGQSGAFIWGNAKEHAARAQIETAQAPVPLKP